MKNWEDLPREDLRMIPKMEEAKFEIIFHTNDLLHRRLTPDNVPNHTVGFSKKNIRVWKCYDRIKDDYWCVADQNFNKLSNHRKYNSLEEVIKNE